MRSYPDFCKAIRDRESSDNYAAVNSLGFLGAYQFGMARLCDLGLTERIDPKSKSMANKSFKWKEGYSQEQFLKDVVLQNQTFDRHVANLKKQILPRLQSYLITVKVDGRLGSVSGAVACCHLLGMGGLRELLVNGRDGKDAYGTKASEYYLKFSGFDLP